MTSIILARADARALPLRDGVAQCCVTSPPYWGQRDYGIAGQLGLEATPEEYVEHMVKVFREVRRVLRDDGVLWLNLGDSYYNYRVGNNGGVPGNTFHKRERHGQPDFEVGCLRRATRQDGLKEKDLVGIPWRVAFALQADGWWLRSDIIWSKPNPMPESVTDRPTRAHEYLFLLTKASSYYYDAEAVRERGSEPDRQRNDRIGGATGDTVRHSPGGIMGQSTTRNMRSVWTINLQPFKGAHYATFPEKLVEPCIKAGSRVGDLVLDPFCGTATVARVAVAYGRRAACFDLSGEYLTELAEKRTHNIQTEMLV